MGRPLEQRVKVVWPALAIGGVLAGVFASKVPGHAPQLWASVMAGPFAGLWATATWGTADALGWAGGCLVAIAAHPLRAGWLTGLITVAGVLLWVLLGLILTFDGV
jgi:hypothetical protein